MGRTIQKMEVRIEELEVMINNEKKSHAATMTELQTKTRSIKELILQSEEDRKNILILQESLERLNEKIKMYKRQLEEQESISNSNIMRVKKFQRELESAESRAEEAESCLNSFRSQQRVFAAAPPPWQRPPAPHGTTGQDRLSPPAGREAWPELLQSGREASAGQAQCSGTSHITSPPPCQGSLLTLQTDQH